VNKAALESYLRNLLGQAIAAVEIVTQTSGIASPIDFTLAEWLLVANALWASLIPTILRWVNKKDPAFGLIAEVAVKEVSKKLTTEAAKAKKPVAKKAVATKKPATPAKKTTKKK
jgi:hypothetical protein